MNVPKSLSRLTITDKKKFIEMFDRHSRDDTYFQYLALNRGEVEWLKEHVVEVRKEVSDWDTKKDKEREAARKEAQYLNELGQMQGSLVVEEEKGGKWKVPHDKESVFLKEAAIKNIETMARKWGTTRSNIEKEINRLESK